MKAVRLGWFLAVLLSLAIGGVARGAADADRVVVMISLDGLAGFYFDDPKAEMPNIRRLAEEGVRAKSMKAVSPTVTWPNHTTLVTGVMPAKHGVIGNNYYDRGGDKSVTLLSDPEFDKDEIVRVPTIYDVAKGAGLKTAAVLWPASRNAKTLDWALPDVATDDILLKYTTPIVQQEAKEAGIKLETTSWHKSNDYSVGDRQDTDVFKLILRKHRPNFALLHLVDVDHMQHANGPQSPQAYAAIKGVDLLVGEVMDELKKNYPTDKITVFIVSDHGFSAIRQAILPNVVLQKAGLLNVKGTKIVGGKARALSQGGACFLYDLSPTGDPATVQKMASAFEGIEGVARILKPEQFKEYGIPTRQQDKHAPDVVLFAKEGYSFGNTTGGALPVTAKSKETKGTHGHDPNLPILHASFVAWGNGIKGGTKLGEMANTDVAPTLAALLGVQMKDVDGRVLKEILK